MIKKYYYKLLRPYGEDYVPIEEKDLERAIYAQITGALFLGMGTLSGNKIEMIVPDVLKTLEWPEGYKIKAEDWRDTGPIRRHGDRKILEAVERVKYLISKGRDKEIGTGVAIPELDAPKQELSAVSDLTKKVADKLEIKC